MPQKSAIGLGTLPLDRFVGLQADQQEGTVTTRPFKLVGGRLTLNADAKDGSICVEVIDPAGQAIDGFSAKDCISMENVDGLRTPALWKSERSLGDLKGQIIRLRFRLRNATIYAFQVQPAGLRNTAKRR